MDEKQREMGEGKDRKKSRKKKFKLEEWDRSERFRKIAIIRERIKMKDRMEDQERTTRKIGEESGGWSCRSAPS